MTTLVALNTRDALVMGCDSLGTVIRRLVDPFELGEYFDDSGEFRLKTDSDGKPILDKFSKIYRKSQLVPYNHMTHVDKLFSLDPLKMAVMSAGEVALGDRTIKNLIGEFKSTEAFDKSTKANYTLKSVGNKLLKFLWQYYSQEYPDERRRPELELMLGGYNKLKHTPGVLRIHVHKNKQDNPDYDFGVFFGAQMKELQRLVFGTDVENRVEIFKRSRDLLLKYHASLSRQLKDSGIDVKLKKPEEFGEELDFFNEWELEGIEVSWETFSEQNAIECVDFLVNIMIKSQQFCTQMPTVGGEVQLAVVKKASGCNFVSRREWRHGDYAIPIGE